MSATTKATASNFIKPITSDDPESKSADMISENIEQMKQLFPDAVVEGKIDFDVLKQLLGDQVEEREEKYGLNWHGKRQARQLALTPSTGTLRPCPEESVDWDTTQNLMIEGDNLEVLKLLQKSYVGKVKLIYIDPPYNTGKDFIYPDRFQNSIENYKELTGQKEGGQTLTSNPETNGRFHTDWLNMIYPRLKLAKELLREDGAIFITIDDAEASRLRGVCDEIFGESNFVANIVWQKKYAPQNDATYFSDMHDHILVYAKKAKSTKSDSSGWSLDLLPRTDSQNAAYRNPDNDPRGVWQSDNLSVKTYSAKNDYPITTPAGRVVNPPESRCWVVTRERYAELLVDNRIWFGADGQGVPRIKRFLTEVQDGTVPVTWWTYEDAGHNQDAKKELKALMGKEVETVFDTPKPLKLIRRMLQLSTKSCPDAIVMDFFSGSGTTGHAVMEQNAEDDGKRKFILVQLPEIVGSGTIADLTKERLRNAANKLRQEHSLLYSDLGFRAYKLDSSNLQVWDVTINDLSETMLSHLEHIKDDRSEEDLLTELLLKLGLELTVPIEKKKFAGHAVYSIGGGALMVCLADKIKSENVEALASEMVEWHQEQNPASVTSVVFRDSGFRDDVAKANMAAILRQNGLNNIRSL